MNSDVFLTGVPYRRSRASLVRVRLLVEFLLWFKWSNGTSVARLGIDDQFRSDDVCHRRSNQHVLMMNLSLVGNIEWMYSRTHPAAQCSVWAVMKMFQLILCLCSDSMESSSFKVTLFPRTRFWGSCIYQRLNCRAMCTTHPRSIIRYHDIRCSLDWQISAISEGSQLSLIDTSSKIILMRLWSYGLDLLSPDLFLQKRKKDEKKKQMV